MAGLRALKDGSQLQKECARDQVELRACTDAFAKHLSTFSMQKGVPQNGLDCGPLSFDVEQALICAGICFVHKTIWRKPLLDDGNMATNAYYQLFNEFKYNERKEGIYSRANVEDTSLQAVAGFILEVLQRGNFSPLDFVMSLFYYSEALGRAELSVHCNVWRLLFVATLLLADKMWEDRCVKTGDFIGAFPVVAKFQMVEMELAVLKLMSFNLFVPASVFKRWIQTLSEEELQLEIGTLVQNSEYVHTMRHELMSRPAVQKSPTSGTRKQSRSPSQDFPSARFNARQTLCLKGDCMTAGKAQVPMMQVRLASSHSPDGVRNATTPAKDKINDVSIAPARAMRAPTDKTDVRPNIQVRLANSHSPDASRNDIKSLSDKCHATDELSTAPARASRVPAERTDVRPSIQVRLASSHSPDTSRNDISSLSIKSHANNEMSTAPARPSRTPVEKTERCLMAQRPKSQPTAGVVQAKLKFSTLAQSRFGQLGTDAAVTKAQDLKKVAVVSSASRLSQARGQTRSQAADVDCPSMRPHSEVRSSETVSESTPISLTPTSKPASTLKPMLVGKQQPKPTASSSGHRIGIGTTGMTRTVNTGLGQIGKVSSPRSNTQGTHSCTARAGTGVQQGASLNDLPRGKGRANSSPGEFGKDPSFMSIQEKKSLFENHAKTQGVTEGRGATTQSVVKTTSAPSSFQVPIALSASGYPQSQNPIKPHAGKLSRTTAQPLGALGSRPVALSASAAASGAFALRGRSSSPYNEETHRSAPGRPKSPEKLMQQPPVGITAGGPLTH